MVKAPHWILLIDPFKNLLNAYQMFLEEEQYCVETASNLEDAYRLFNERRYSIIIIEYIPSDETAERIIRWMKEKSPEVYILLVTNEAVDEKTYEKLFSLGVDYFILKPYSPEKILVHIKKGLEQRDLILKLQQLEKLSLLTPTTKEVQALIFNTLFFKRCLRQEIKRAKRYHHLFSLVLIQVPTGGKIGDHFDDFYMELIKMVKKYTREEDTVGKSNGEIGIILPETDQFGSKSLIQRLLNLFRTHPPFKSDDILKSYLNNLSFQYFTYPDQFAIPEPLKAVLESVDKEYLQH